MPKTLTIGLIPEVVDYAKFPELSLEKVKQGLAESHKIMQDAGYDEDEAMITTDEDKAVQIVLTFLKENIYDVICIGNGIRSNPDCFFLYEKLTNVVHHFAPKAKICFNNTPMDTFDGVKRVEKGFGLE